MTTPVTQRLLSLDALHGFDMFGIVGAEELVRGLEKITTNGPLAALTRAAASQ